LQEFDMPLRTVAFAGLLGAAALASGAALAGEVECASCYRHVERPPVYAVVSEQVLVEPARTITRTVPAQYDTVSEKVLVAPARREWQVTRGPHGETIGCWVVHPAQYAVRRRSVLVRPEQVVPETIPAVYVTRSRSVLVEPARAGWEPIAVRPVLVDAPARSAYGRRGIFGAAFGG
jgi:hypothetical protein